MSSQTRASDQYPEWPPGLLELVDKGVGPYRWADVDDWAVAVIAGLFAAPV
jgi:hypothetical protein